MSLPEQWRAVSSHYEVSDLGRVRRLRHTVMRSNGRPYTKTEIIMNGSKDSDGYRQVRIDGRLMSVHILVARAQAIDVKSRIAAGETNASIARFYGVDPSMISNIKRGYTWSGL